MTRKEHPDGESEDSPHAERSHLGTVEEFMDGVPTDPEVLAQDLAFFRETGLFNPDTLEETREKIEQVWRGESDVFLREDSKGR